MNKNNKEYVFLEYTFLFDPNDTWDSLQDFEKSLGKFFGNEGYEARIVKTVEGQTGKRILMIENKPDEIKPLILSTRTPSQQLNTMKVNGNTKN